MSATTTPVALIAICMFRDGLVTAGAEDAWIDNIEGTETVHATDGNHFLFTSSTSAPFGNTGGSESTNSYARFAPIDNYIKSGATIGSTFKEYCYVNGFAGGDDLTSYMSLYGYTFNTDKFGATIDVGEWSLSSPMEHVLLGYDPVTNGLQSYTFNTASSHNPSGYAWSVYRMEGDTGGWQSGTWLYIYEWSGNNPRFRLFTISYPALALASTPQRTLMDLGT